MGGGLTGRRIPILAVAQLVGAGNAGTEVVTGAVGTSRG